MKQVRSKQSVEAHETAKSAAENVRKMAEQQIAEAEARITAMEPPVYTVEEVTNEKGKTVDTGMGAEARAEKGMFILKRKGAKEAFILPPDQMQHFEEVSS